MKTDYFKALTQESSKLKQSRAINSHQFYEKGLNLLDSAQSDGFSNSALLPQACEFFLKALKSNREDVRPYFSLAYVFLILQDLNTASGYLKEVLLKEPGHELALQMQTQIVNELKQKKARPLLSSSDGEWDSLKEQLQSKVKHIMETPFFELKFDNKGLNSLKEVYALEIQNKQSFESRLDQLDKEEETLELRQFLHPIQIYTKRIYSLIQVNEGVLALAKKIDSEFELLEQCIQEAESTVESEDIEILEENLEALYANQSDYLNALNDWADQGFNLGPVHQKFQTLTLMTQRFEDVIDDASERLT